MRRAAALLVLCVAGCAADPTPRAERWPTDRIVLAARAGGTVAGFAAQSLVSAEGGALPFRGVDYGQALVTAARAGWSVLPAYARGQPAAYLVTEVWSHHPDPWIQPVYLLMTKFEPFTRQTFTTADGGTARVPVVFGVGEESTFYSPYWESILATTRAPAPDDGLPDARAVLANAAQVRRGGKPLCPIAPAGFGLAAAAGGPAHPFTGAPLTQRNADPVRIDGATARYVDFGLDRFQATPGGVITPTRIFFFTRTQEDGSQLLLELPAVLSDNAKRSAYARRFDVALASEAVFVPAGEQWNTLRARFKAPPADPLIPADVAAAYTLRVARSSACFASAASFPAGCQWLDSEAAIDELDPRRVSRTEVTLTAIPVLLGGEQL